MAGAKSAEYVTQVTAMGLGLEYRSAKDDPRNNNSQEESEQLFVGPKERVL